MLVSRYVAAPLCFVVVLITLLSSCGTTSTQPGPGTDTGSLAFPQLPAPGAALAKSKGVSAQVLTLSGGSYEAALPNQNVAIAGGYGRFTPEWEPQADKEYGDMAYAMYRLNLEGNTGSSLLRLVGAQGGVEAQHIYVGLADWTADRWVWKRLSGGGFNPPGAIDTAGYVGPSGDVLVCLVVIGMKQYDLSLLTVLEYDEVEPNSSVPTAQLVNQPGVHGFHAHVGGSDTVDVFAFPAEGLEDFNGWIRFDEGAELSYTLRRADGSEIGSGESFSGADYLQIFDGAGSPLDASESPVTLEVDAVSGETDYYISFAGSISLDIGLLTVDPVSGVLPFTTTFTWPVVNSPDTIYKWDVDGNQSIDALTSVPTLQWTYTKSGLFVADVTASNSAGNEVHAQVTVGAGLAYNEVEDNDVELDANMIDASFAETGWMGNIGEGPGGFDSDQSDYVTLEVPSGWALMVTLTDLDNADADSVMDLFDGPFQEGAGSDRRKMLFNPIGSMDFQTFAVRNNPGPAADYKLTWEQGHPPHLVPDPGTVWTGPAPFTLNLTVTPEDEDGDLVTTAEWDFNHDDDYTDASGFTISPVYNSPGTYEVYARAYDDKGFLGYVSYVFEVTP